MISIIVPVYKVEDYLERCLESIVCQTYKRIEIILVNDGSPDRCPQICDEWAHKDARIKVIHQENHGVSIARNNGLKVATGEYLCFVDGDDTIDPRLCEKVMQVFAHKNTDIVVFDCEQISEAGESLGGTEQLVDGHLEKAAALSNLVGGRINGYVWNKVFKRYVFADISFPEGRSMLEDLSVSYKAFLKADRIYCLNQKLYFYLRRSTSVTAEMSVKKLADIYQARKECYLDLKTEYPKVGDKIFGQVAVDALRLYDRSLWEMTDRAILADAVSFLEKNKEKVLEKQKEYTFQCFYQCRWLYNVLRIGKHWIGNVVKYISGK